jgi:excisionase family DNA binding protein
LPGLGGRYNNHLCFIVAALLLLLYNFWDRRTAMFDPDFIYTTDEIAKLLRVHPQTVKRWLRAGELRGALLADRTGWRVLGSDLQAFWDAHLNIATNRNNGTQDDEEKAG